MKVSREDYINYLKEISGEYTCNVILVSLIKLIEGGYNRDYLVGLSALAEKLSFISKLRIDEDSTLFIDEYKDYLKHLIIDSDENIVHWTLLYLTYDLDCIDLVSIRSIYNCLTNYLANLYYFKIEFEPSDLANVIDYIIINKGELEDPIFMEDDIHELALEPTNWDLLVPIGDGELSMFYYFNNDNEYINEYLEDPLY